MFIHTLTLNSSIRARAVWNRHISNDLPELNSTLHPATRRSSGTVVGRAWDHILGHMATFTRKHWSSVQDESFVKLSKGVAASSLPESGSPPTDAPRASAQLLRPALPFSPRPATVYALPSLASSIQTLPPTPGPLTPIQECSQEPELGGKVKAANPDPVEEENASIGEVERVVAIGNPSLHFGRQPKMVTMRLGEWDVVSTRKGEADVDSEARPVSNDSDRRTRLGCSSTMVTMTLGEFDLASQRPKVQAHTGKHPRTVTMRLGEFDLSRKCYEDGRDGSVVRGECKRMIPPARFVQGSPMVTMRLGEFDLAVGRMWA
ncbi:hypothetical protein EW145_g1424 [Phellinidium pouzarii]|uniref:Uncharacterized protein n=1 Tax=Phellinidium pouzarii TaxID=167371 RepID=A0A4S4LF04_9AGAM|nr:hypothetical protein EW145_g1424 [Phellinidium pouzarii]